MGILLGTVGPAHEMVSIVWHCTQFHPRATREEAVAGGSAHGHVGGMHAQRIVGDGVEREVFVNDDVACVVVVAGQPHSVVCRQPYGVAKSHPHGVVECEMNSVVNITPDGIVQHDGVVYVDDKLGRRLSPLGLEQGGVRHVAAHSHCARVVPVAVGPYRKGVSRASDGGNLYLGVFHKDTAPRDGALSGRRTGHFEMETCRGMDYRVHYPCIDGIDRPVDQGVVHYGVEGVGVVGP